MALKKTKHTSEKMHEGLEKIFYYHEEEYALTQHFKDTAIIDGVVSEVSGKGVLRNAISAFLMEKLDLVGIEHHFIEKINMREQVVQMADIIPMRVVLSYLASGRYVHDFGMEEGMVFDKPMLDFRFKAADGSYPVVCEEQIMHLCYMNAEAMQDIKKIVYRTGDFLAGLFAGAGIRLVDISLTLGTVFDGHDFVILIADEISPANCRLWDLSDNTKLDFEHIISHPEDTIPVYQEVAKRLGVVY